MKTEEKVGELLKAKNFSLSTAESCTGGGIAALITSVPGSSEYFKGGIVAYSNEVKADLLHVSVETLAQYGAVSRETVVEMVKGAMKTLKTDCAVATSGIAGPGGGTPEKPVGTVWIAAACKNEIVTMKQEGDRGRAENVQSAIQNALFRQMSVEDNIAAVLEMTDKPLDYQKDKLESLIAEFRLQKVRKNKGNQLSGGERRRTEIARCLAIDPKFIMLDEPFAGVDPIAVEDIQQIVWKLKDRNIGILITDHNVQETLSITDRAYLLFEGKILFQGTPEELAENKIVREKYLSNSFVLRRKDFMG